MPMVDRVEIYVIEETQPRWLAFLNKELDWINVPTEFLNTVLPGNKEAPWAVKRGIRYMPDVDPDVTYLYWNMKDPVVGGYTPDKVALRRAIGLAYDNEEEINLHPQRHARSRRRARSRRGSWATTPTSTPARATTPRRRRRSSTCSDTWTAMVTDGATCPTAARSCSTTPPRRPSSIAPVHAAVEEKEHERRRHLRVDGRPRSPKWPDLRKESKLQKLQDVGGGLERATTPTARARASTSFSTGPTAARPTTAASSCPSSTPPTTRRARSRWGRSAPKLYDQMARIVAAYAPVEAAFAPQAQPIGAALGAGMAQAPLPPRCLPVRRHRPRGEGERAQMTPIITRFCRIPPP